MNAWKHVQREIQCTNAFAKKLSKSSAVNLVRRVMGENKKHPEPRNTDTLATRWKFSCIKVSVDRCAHAPNHIQSWLNITSAHELPEMKNRRGLSIPLYENTKYMTSEVREAKWISSRLLGCSASSTAGSNYGRQEGGRGGNK